MTLELAVLNSLPNRTTLIQKAGSHATWTRDRNSSLLIGSGPAWGNWFAVLNGMLAVEVLFAVLSRLFVSVNASIASFARSFSKIDLSFRGICLLRRFDKD